MSEALSTMIEALGLEVAAIRKKGGGAQVELRGGERLGQAEGSWLYRFVVTEDRAPGRSAHRLAPFGVGHASRWTSR